MLTPDGAVYTVLGLFFVTDGARSIVTWRLIRDVQSLRAIVGKDNALRSSAERAVKLSENNLKAIALLSRLHDDHTHELASLRKLSNDNLDAVRLAVSQQGRHTEEFISRTFMPRKILIAALSDLQRQISGDPDVKAFAGLEVDGIEDGAEEPPAPRREGGL